MFWSTRIISLTPSYAHLSWGVLLKTPLALAVAGIRAKNGHRPLVGAGGLLAFPGGWVPRAVVEEIQLGIVGDPPPGAPSASLPLIAPPSLYARVLPHR